MKIININNFEEKIYNEKLDNGLDVYLIPYQNKNVSSALLGTKFGGIYTKFMVNNQTINVPSGIAHFLEHKMFEEKDSENPFSFYAKSGANANAGTSFDSTVYYFSGNDKFNENLEFLLNYVSKLYLTEENIEKEKGIILEEAKMYEDNPDWVMFDRLRYNLYVNHPMKYKIIGSLEDIQSITLKDLQLCYESFYNPSNMFLVAAGDFNPEEVLKIVKKNQKQSSKVEASLCDFNEPDKVFKEYEELELETNCSKVSYGIKINKDLFTVKDIYYLKQYLYMAFTLAFGQTSSFKEQMRSLGLITWMDYEISDIKSHIVISFIGESENPKKLIEKLEEYLKTMHFDEDSFERIKKVWVASEIKMIDNISITIDNVVYDLINYNEFKSEKIKDIKGLTYENLLKTINEISLEHTSIVVINPKDGKK